MTDATHKNMLTIMQHSKNNKVEIEKLQTTVRQLQSEKMAMGERIDALAQQVQHMQVAVFSGGPTA